MKAIVRLKSFPNHQGIPGHQGGSLPADESGKLLGEVSSYADIKASGNPAYLITSDDRVVGVPGEHANYPAESGHPEVFGMTEAQAKKFSKAYDDYSDDVDKYWNKFFKAGTIRVLESGDDVNIETAKLDRATLRRLQGLADEGKLGINKNIIWTDHASSIMNSFSREDFMSAKYVRIDERGNLELKQYKVVKLKV